MEQQTDPSATAVLGQTPAEHVSQADILVMLGSVRRFTRSRLTNPHDVDDVVQETVAKVLGVRDRLEPATLTAYAVTVARHEIASLHRGAAVAKRNQPRVVDLREVRQPAEDVLASEDRRALGEALAGLPTEQRDQLVAHVVDDVPLSQLSGPSSPGALAARMNRTRARLRLDYLLALRKVELPTTRCRPVLLAVSAGDLRRQQALRAGRHLLTCTACGDLSEPLVRRERALAIVLPWLLLVSGGRAILRFVRGHAIATGATATAAAAVTAAVVLHGAPPPHRPPSALDTTAGASVLPRNEELHAMVGKTVQAHGVRVLAVPADEGFWVGQRGRRVWVQLATHGESQRHIRVGQHLSFSGKVVVNSPAFLKHTDVGKSRARRLIDEQGAHLRVRPETVTFSS